MCHKGRKVSEITAEHAYAIDINICALQERAKDAHIPIVWLRERRLLMSEQPAVGIRGMDDVDISPNERARRRGERHRGFSTSHVSVSMFPIRTG